jgi:hypothetical protein
MTDEARCVWLYAVTAGSAGLPGLNLDLGPLGPLLAYE